MKNNSFVLKGDIIYNKNLSSFYSFKDGYLVCENGISKGVFKTYPEEYKDFKFYDYTGKLIIPGMIDLHIHAPQFAFRGMYMDEQLLDWLNKYTFKEESKYSDIEYANKAYDIFVDVLKHSATTRVSIFSTIHKDATLLLMKKMEKSGLISYVGKVNMDRNAPKKILDKSIDSSINDTLEIIEETKHFKNTYPILTPRFIPACSDELLIRLKDLVHTYDIPVQSHLSENEGEIDMVHKLVSNAKCYGDAYDKYDLFGKPNKTIMAHCVHSTEEEIKLMQDRNIFIAHCPSSNLNIESGIAPITKYLKLGLNVGFGSDVAGGESESIFDEIKKAIEISKMYHLYIDNKYEKLSFENSFYLATLGGGKFFGKVGSFAKGYEVDIVVLDDEKELHPQDINIVNRLERAVYLRTDKNRILAKFVKGKKIL